MHPNAIGLALGLRALLAFPAKSRDEIAEWQNRALRRVIANAYQNVPHYSDLFDQAGIRPDDIQTTADLSRIPFTTRAQIQQMEPSRICSRQVDPRRLLVRRTSGSTGAPLSIRRHWMEERVLLLYRRLTELQDHQGIYPMRRAKVTNPKPVPKGRIYHERLRVPADVIDWRTPPERIVQHLIDHRVHTLLAPPSLLNSVAEYLEAHPETRPGVRYVQSTQETLLPSVQQRLERAFGAPVRGGYGSHEFVAIGRECLQHAGYYHLHEELVAVEVLNDGKPVEVGEQGELVGTALHSYAMPFIRYPQGDLVVRGPDTCPCGAPYRTLCAISGRVIDLLEFPDGARLHPYEIARPLRDGVLDPRLVQIIQPEPDRIRVVVIPGVQPTPKQLADSQRIAEKLVAGRATVSLELVDSIPTTRSGKFHPYISYTRYRAWRDAGINPDNI